MSGLPDELTYGLADGIYRKKLTRLILDDWWVNRSRLRTVTVMISQRPTEEWDGSMGDNTFADEFPGSLMHNAKRLDINGESMRKRPAQVN